MISHYIYITVDLGLPCCKCTKPMCSLASYKHW